MGSYNAVVETADDGTLADAAPLVVELRNARTGRREQLSLDEFTGGHLLHLAVAGCVYNDLMREARARGITLSQVKVSADGGFAGNPCASTGIEYRIRVEGDASEAELEQLVAYVEEIAEVPSAIRLGAQVRLAESEVVSTLG
jgi:organic hydroperoxide reductase OsmC/OhrA